MICKYGYWILFLKEIVLVKIIMKDEGGVGGYICSNWIVLMDVIFQWGIEVFYICLLVYEIFYILICFNFGFKKKLYRVIDFNILFKEIEFFEDIWKSCIFNFDVSCCDSYVIFIIDGKLQNCIMIIYINRFYIMGKFYQYINVGLILLDELFKFFWESGKIVIYLLQKVIDFFDKVGWNIGYVIDLEEVLVDNFVIVLLNMFNVYIFEL